MSLAVHLLALSCLTLSAVNAADFYVSPSGSDAWTGRAAVKGSGQDGPFATLERARAAVASSRAAGAQPAATTVVEIAPGSYQLSEPWRFAPGDSGTLQAPVVYRGAAGGVVISGGTRITGWKVENGRWTLSLPVVAQGRWCFSQLFVNGQRRYRPRLPKDGYYRIERTLQPTESSQGKGYDRFGFPQGSLRSDWSARADIDLLVFHIWTMSRNKLGAIDEASRVVTLAAPTVSSSNWAALNQGQRFLVENVKEALSEPGEWYLDRASGVLTYIPLPGENPETAEVVAPAADRLLVLAGDVESQRWVQYLRFENLTFAYSNWNTPEKGYHFPQAEASLSAAVTGVGARNIALKDCAIEHVGEYAVEWGPACQYNEVSDCTLSDLGAGGVKLGTVVGAGSSTDDQERQCSHNTVEGCVIAHGGRMHPAGIGVFIGHSPYNVVRNNAIFDLYYSGVSVGWSWGYGKSHAHHNRIEGNHMWNLGQGVLSDMGGVYTLGISPGTVVRGNRIHDVESYEYGGWGLYTDEGSTGIVMEKNVVYRTKSTGFHQHYGRDNEIRNNVFALGREAQIRRSRQEEHNSFTFEHNLVYFRRAPLLDGNWQDHFQIDHNLYWNAAGATVEFQGKSLAEWQAAGHDVHSRIADPGFVDPDSGDFRLKDASPASTVGFDPSGMLLAPLPAPGVAPAAPAFPRQLPKAWTRAEQLLLQLDLDRPGLEPVKAASNDPLDALALLLQYYQHRTSVKHPVDRSTRPHLRGKYATQEELAAADRAVKHVFIAQPSYPPHFVGTDIDWASSPVPDREWIWQLHRMYFWDDLEKAYWHTGDEKYARAWGEQLLDWVEKNPRDRAHAYAWRSIEAGIRGHAWMDAYQHFIDSPAFTPEVLSAFLSSCHDHAAYLMTQYRSGSNWALMEAEGLGHIGFMFPEFRDAETWRKTSVERLTREINIQVRPDGHQREQCINYHTGCIAWFTRTAELARLNGQGELFGREFFERIQKMCDVLLALGQPDGGSAQFGDTSSRVDVRSALREWSGVFHRDDYRFIASAGKQGATPVATDFALPDSGFYSMRSGWDENAMCLVLKCGPDGGGHCQPDNGTFELFAGGRRLTPDTGVYIYSGDDAGRRWFRQTSVHQTLTLDNRNSAYAPKLDLWKPGKNLDTLVVENGSYEGLTHRRAVFFVNQRFFVLVDDALGAASGELRLHFQLAPGGMKLDPSAASVRTAFARGTNLLIQGMPQAGVELVQEEGQVSFHYGSRQPRPALAFRADKGGDVAAMRFTTVLVPYAGQVPAVRIKGTEGAPGSSTLAAEVEVDGKAYQVGCDLEKGNCWLR